MAVNFKKPACVTVTNEAIFGICDDAPPSVEPAYLSFQNAEKWIAWVENNQKKDVTFTAIDQLKMTIRIYTADVAWMISTDIMLMLQINNALILKLQIPHFQDNLKMKQALYLWLRLL